MLDRLIDLLLIAVLRAWFTRPEAEAPAWYRSQGDPVVGRTLQIMHKNPGHPWTVAGLATEVGVSRAALSRRFHDLVGEPPMTFLTGWRSLEDTDHRSRRNQHFRVRPLALNRTREGDRCGTRRNRVDHYGIGPHG